jgi:hypothetical protein
MNNSLAPILFIIFNRPDTTQRVFERIRAARPKQLYISADGPRANRPADAEKCKATRAIVEQIDWDCEVHYRFLEENLGCRRAVSSAITWFFEQVEMGMILEDDCLPDPSFFGFATECLEKYKDDDRVFHINGSNYQLGWVRDTDYSYHFSRLNSIWGWASWRRAWKHYDVNIPNWPEVKRKGYHFDFALNRVQALTLENAFDSVYEGRMDTWDFQWTFTILSNNGLSIIPNKNLISNIGFDGEATHTVTKNKRSNLPTQPLALPLQHPPFVIEDMESSKRLFNMFGRRGYVWRLKNWNRLFFK